MIFANKFTIVQIWNIRMYISSRTEANKSSYFLTLHVGFNKI